MKTIEFINLLIENGYNETSNPGEISHSMSKIYYKARIPFEFNGKTKHEEKHYFFNPITEETLEIHNYFFTIINKNGNKFSGKLFQCGEEYINNFISNITYKFHS